MSDFVCPEGARLIPLRGKKAAGRFAVISESDYAWVSQFNWFLTSNGYVARACWEDGKNVQRALHRDLTQPKAGDWVDHLDADRLNNRRENLRTCDPQQNNFNRRKGSRGKGSQFKGVRHPAKTTKLAAGITHQGEHISLGRYLTEEDAARAYDAAARYLFGEFAQTNFDGTEALPPDVIRSRSQSETKYTGRFKK